MRSRPIVLTPTLLLLAAACARNTTPPPPPKAAAVATPPAKEKQEIAGTPVTTEGEGAWRVRRTVTDEKAAKAAPESSEGFVATGALGGAADSAPAPSSPSSVAAAPAERRADVGRVAGDKAAAVEYEETASVKPKPAEAMGYAAATAPVTPLRAGATDDNEDYDEFLGFLATREQAGLGQYVTRLDVRDRSFLRVQGADGKPVPGARVVVTDEDRDAVVWSATTYGDGRVPFYPHVAGSGSQARLVMEVAKDGQTVRTPLSAADSESRVTLAAGQKSGDDDVVRLDVLFVIDTTGSMGDEIDRIKGTLLSVTTRLRSLSREMDLRYGAVLYRDLGDAYVTRTHPFTGDIEAFDRELQQVAAGGGGDTPESLNQGLAEAVNGVQWRDGSAHVAFLIADAPPHMDYQDDVPYDQSLKAAVAKGIRIHAVAASGLDEFGTLVFRQIAQFTRGKFVFIEYGTSSESAASHGVTGYVSSNNLDDILYEQIAAEAAGWGRDV